MSQTQVILSTLVAIPLFLILWYRPWIDITKDGDVVLWYSKRIKNKLTGVVHNYRQFKILGNICK